MSDWENDYEEYREEFNENDEAPAHFGDETASSFLDPEEDSLGGLYGSESDYTRQLKRFQATSAGVQRIAVGWIRNPDMHNSVTGTGNIEEALESFRKVISGDLGDFANDLELGLRNDPTKASRASIDVKTAFSMLGKTASNYSQHGSPMYGSEPSEVRSKAADDELKWATNMLGIYANKAVLNESITGVNRDFQVSKVENWLAERAITHDNKAERLVDWSTGEPMVHEDGKPWFKSTVVPAIKEIPNVHGLDMMSSFSGVNPTQAMKENTKQDFLRIRKALRGEALTISDEFHNNTQRSLRVTGTDTSYDEEANLRNEAEILGLDKSKYSGAVENDLKGNKDTEFSIYVSGRMEGIDSDELLSNTYGASLYAPSLTERDKVRYPDKNLAEVNLIKDVKLGLLTDQEAYVKRQEINPQPIQGTEAWLKARFGKINASSALGVNASLKSIMNYGASIIGKKIDGSELVDKPEFYAGIHAEEGSAAEGMIQNNLKAFIAGRLDKSKVSYTGPSIREQEVSVEEAFSETNPKLKGFSASPDGFIFNKKGESLGLTEYKYLGKESMEKSMDKYRTQLQLQMAVTGEKQVHFFRQRNLTREELDAGEKEFHYDVVKEDPVLQAKLIKTNSRALEYSDYLKKGGKPMLSQSEINQRATSDATILEDPAADVEGTIFEEHSREVVDNARLKLEKKETKQLHKEIAARRLGIELMEGSNEAQKQQIMRAREVAEQDREKAKASKQLSDGFKTLVVSAGGLANTFGLLGKEGIKSQMRDVRLGAKTGMTGQEARSLRDNLHTSGLSAADSQSTILTAGALQTEMNDPTRMAAKTASMTGSLVSSDLGYMGFDPSAMVGMSTREIIGYALDAGGKAENIQDRNRFYNTIGLSDLATARNAGTNEFLTGAEALVKGRALHEAVARVDQKDYVKQDQVVESLVETATNKVGGTATRNLEAFGSVTATVTANTLAIGALTKAIIANTVVQSLSGKAAGKLMSGGSRMKNAASSLNRKSKGWTPKGDGRGGTLLGLTAAAAIGWEIGEEANELIKSQGWDDEVAMFVGTTADAIMSPFSSEARDRLRDSEKIRESQQARITNPEYKVEAPYIAGEKQSSSVNVKVTNVINPDEIETVVEADGVEDKTIEQRQTQ